MRWLCSLCSSFEYAASVSLYDNPSLGSQETGGRVALPVFKEVMARVYCEKVPGRAPPFPAGMEQHIDSFLQNGATQTAIAEVIAPTVGSAAVFASK